MCHFCSKRVLRLAIIALAIGLGSINATAAPDAAAGRPLFGVVTDDHRQPLADVPVWLVNAANTERMKPKPEVFAQTKSDAQGQFRVTIPERWFETAHSWRPELAVIAYRTGRKPTALYFGKETLPSEKGIELVLAASRSQASGSPASFRLLSPDNRPLAGAKVTVRWMLANVVRGPTNVDPDDPPEADSDAGAARRELVTLPAELSAVFTAHSDDQGRISFADLDRPDLGGVRVETTSFGVQQIASYVYPWLRRTAYAPWPESVTLQPVGKIVGQLAAETPASASGVPLIIQTNGSNDPDMTKATLLVYGTAKVTSDSEGRFEVPTISIGHVLPHLDPAADSKYFPQGTQRLSELQAGGEVKLELAMKPLVQVTGVIRSRGDGRPLAEVYGAINALGIPYGQPTFRTGKDGRFQFRALPGQIYWSGLWGHGLAPLSPLEFAEFPREIPATVTSWEMPPLDVSPRTTVRGTVRDAAGQPMPGANVVAVWVEYGYRLRAGMARIVVTTADSTGSFAVSGVDSGKQMWLKAFGKSACTQQPVVARGPELAKPVLLTISREFAKSATGRIVNEENQPQPGVAVELWWRPAAAGLLASLPKPKAMTGAGPIPQESMPLPLGPVRVARFPLPAAVVTDNEGRFQIPKLLDADGEYQIVVQAEGCLPARTAWRSAPALASKEPMTFPDLRLNKRRPMEGEIVDRAGKPVAGAKVTRADSTARHEITTDASGRFKLDLIIDRPGFLFVDAAGFRFHGQIHDSTKPVRVTLTRADESPPTLLKTLPPKLSKEERQALAEKLLAPQRERALAKDRDDDRLRPLENLAQTDPARVLEEIEKKPFANPWYNDYIRRAVVKRVLRDSVEEARTIADAMRDPGFRVAAYLDLCAAIPAEKKDEQRKLLAEALVHARGIPAADHRVISLGQVAEKLLALGDKDQAAKILREAEEAAKQLPTSAWAGYARGAFAESLAMIDLPAALDLIKDLKDAREFDRHHGNIADLLAATNPAEAERVLGMVRSDWQRGRYAQRVCYRLATVDPKRARYLAEQIKSVLDRSYTLGLLARALAKTDPKQASEMLNEAFTFLRAQADKGEEDFNNFVGSSSLAAMLVPVAEQIDPATAGEYFWRAVSFRVPHVRDARLQDFDTQNPTGCMADASLAEAAARYDRAVAQLLIEESAPSLLGATSGNHLFEAATLTDPALALRLLEQLPDDGKKEYFREKIAVRLLRDGDALWRVVHRDLGLWWVEDDER